MALGKDYAGQACALARALELVGERWTLLIVRDLFYGVRRFSDFLAHLDIPRAVLTTRLQALADTGVVERRRYQEAPPRDEYVLTPMGEDLWPAVYALSRWAQVHVPSALRARREYRHAACGTALDGAGMCPVCGTGQLPAREIEVVPVGEGPVSDRTDAVALALNGPRRLLEPLLVDA